MGRFFLTLLLQLSLSMMHAAGLVTLAAPIVSLSPGAPAAVDACAAVTPAPVSRTRSVHGQTVAPTPPPSPPPLAPGKSVASSAARSEANAADDDATPAPPLPKRPPLPAPALAPRARWLRLPLRLPPSLRPMLQPMLQPMLLLLLGGYAFAAEPLLQHAAALADDALSGGTFLDENCLRLEPMLACMVAGFSVCNLLGYRRAFGALLESVMPPLLAFFFFSTGSDMRVGALRHTWPVALCLFGSRLLALWLGTCAGSRVAGLPPAQRHYSWMAYVTQAGVTLGLADEIAAKFPSWGPGLQAQIVSAVVLSQLLGPPLLKFALHAAGDARPSGLEDGPAAAALVAPTPKARSPSPS